MSSTVCWKCCQILETGPGWLLTVDWVAGAPRHKVCPTTAPTTTPSSGEEVQAAMELAEAYSERMRNTETLDLLSSEGNARDVVWKEFRDRHTALYERECAALARYRNSKPAPSGGRGGA